MARKRVTVIQQDQNGRNVKFRDNYKNTTMSLNQFVRQIENGNYENFHIREINGVKTPVSNPDSSKLNNLG